MSRNLTQKQFNWLLKVVWGNGSHQVFGVPREMRDKAYVLLSKCGYVREYNDSDRIELLELREDYARWLKEGELDDDLPF